MNDDKYSILYCFQIRMGLTWDMTFVRTVPGMAMSAEVVSD